MEKNIFHCNFGHKSKKKVQQFGKVFNPPPIREDLENFILKFLDSPAQNGALDQPLEVRNIYLIGLPLKN